MAGSAAAIESFGQLIRPTASSTSTRFASGLRASTIKLTCWGSRRLNLARASDDAVRWVCEKHAGARLTNDLLAIRREADITGLDEVLKRLTLRRGEQVALRQLLTDQSTCYSLWIETHVANRRSLTLAVRDTNSSSRSTVRTFRW